MCSGKLDIHSTPAGYADAIRLLDAVNGSRRVTVLRVPQVAEIEAWEWLRQHADREYSLWMPPVSR